MTVSPTIKIIIIAALVYSCQDTGRLDKSNKEQAKKNIQLLDGATLQLFKTWNYTQRGGELWSKSADDSADFICWYVPSPDSPKIKSSRIARLLHYFQSDLTIDTGYHQIEITKIDTTLRIMETSSQEHDHKITSYFSFHSAFPKPNPFDTLSILSELKKKLNVIGIGHDKRVGDFIQFYLPGGQHVLTYLPDTLLHSEHLKKNWKEEFLKGERLAPNWNFRKLEQPLDQG